MFILTPYKKIFSCNFCIKRLIHLFYIIEILAIANGQKAIKSHKIFLRVFFTSETSSFEKLEFHKKSCQRFVQLKSRESGC